MTIPDNTVAYKYSDGTLIKLNNVLIQKTNVLPAINENGNMLNVLMDLFCVWKSKGRLVEYMQPSENGQCLITEHNCGHENKK